MKKIVVLLVVLFVSSNIWALNPPSYVGRNIHEVLQELDGMKVCQNYIYKIFLDDTKILTFLVDSTKVVSASYERTYYSSSSLGDTVMYAMIDGIFSKLVKEHRDYLGDSDRDPYGKLTDFRRWSGEKVGQYFMNPEIKSYTIFKSLLDDSHGIEEIWVSNP